MRFNSVLFALVFFTGPALAHGSLHSQIKDLTATMRHDGKSAKLLVQRGRLQMEHGNHKAATDDFLLALKLEPGERTAYFYLAEQAFNQDRLPAARRYADKFLGMLRGEPGAIVRGRSLYGQILMAQGDYRAAAASFRIAVDHAAEPSPEHYLHIADALSKAGSTADALASLDEGMEKLGMLPVLQNKAVSVNVASKSWDAALDRLDALIMHGQGLPELYLRKARVLREAERLPAARQVVGDGLALLEEVPAARRETPAMKQVRAELMGMLAEH